MSLLNIREFSDCGAFRCWQIFPGLRAVTRLKPGLVPDLTTHRPYLVHEQNLMPHGGPRGVPCGPRGPQGPALWLWLLMRLVTLSDSACEDTTATAVSSSMLQRHFESTDAAHHFENAGRNFGGLNQSFEKELKELYLQQVELERSFSHQDPTATGRQTGTEPPDSISDSVKAAGEGTADAIGNISQGTVDAIGNLTNLAEETKAEVEYFLANHTPGKMLVYWFGPFAGWACADSAFSTQQVCGYFGGWLNYETFVLLLFIPVAVLVIYIYFILDFVLIDTTDPAFDDEEFRRQHGWSLAQHQWELKYILGSFALPLELVILWQLGLLQILLQALAPYLVAALIICTGLAPIIVTTYIQVSRRLHSLCQRFAAVEHMLESLTKHIMGDIEAIKDTLRAGFSTPRLANDSASSAPHEPKGEAKVPRPGCC